MAAVVALGLIVGIIGAMCVAVGAGMAKISVSKGGGGAEGGGERNPTMLVSGAALLAVGVAIAVFGGTENGSTGRTTPAAVSGTQSTGIPPAPDGGPAPDVAPSSNPASSPSTMKVSYSGPFTVKGLGPGCESASDAGVGWTATYVNLDSQKQEADVFASVFTSHTGVPADIEVDCDATGTGDRAGIAGAPLSAGGSATVPVGTAPAVQPDAATCAQDAKAAAVSKLYLTALVPGKTAFCVLSSDGDVIWMRYESGGAITGDTMTPDLTFSIVVWKQP